MAKRFPLDAKDSSLPAKNRFNFNSDDDDFEHYKQRFIAKNTANDIPMCLRLFKEWKDKRNARFPNNPVPQKILQGGNKVALCKCQNPGP